MPVRAFSLGARAPFVIYAIIAANIAMFVYQISLNESDALIFMLRNAIVPRAFFEPVWANYNGIKPGDYWPLLTSMFMHGGWLHLLLNMWALLVFGPALEQRLGHIQFLVFYLICGVAASLLHIYLSKQSSSQLVGASGAIAGAVAAYAALYPNNKLFVFPIPIPVPMWFLATAFLSLQVYQVVEEMSNPLEGDGIAWWAHIGGFGAGLAILPLFLLIKPWNQFVRGQAPRAEAVKDDRAENSSPPEKGPWG